MVTKILVKKNYRDNDPELYGSITDESSPMLGDIIEIDGKNYVVVERRWTINGLCAIVEKRNATGVIKA